MDPFVPLFTLAVSIALLFVARQRVRAGQTANVGVMRGAALVALLASLAALAFSAVLAARYGVS